MVSVVDVVGLLVIIGVNAALAAVLTRVFRDRLETRWGSMLYTLLLAPVVLVAVFLVLGGAGLGGGFTFDSATAVGLVVLLPLAVGIAFDYFWMPAPEEVQLPERHRD